MKEIKNPNRLNTVEFWKQMFPECKEYIVLCKVDGDNQDFLKTVIPGREGLTVNSVNELKQWNITGTTLVPRFIFENWEEVADHFEVLIEKNPISAWRNVYESYIDYAITHM